MTHLALYRTWRPQRFDEVVGQEQTVKILKNSVRKQQTSHAYLFAGPRGTGKTSLAKILARAVNCENPQEGEPCNECRTCRDILNGNFMDVIEIDAASNRGIDEIRSLRAQVNILPAQGRKKVYIIDEVHMLTTEAFNALLKTLEEPPENVVFILATTETQKIPATILSRCQKYQFLRLSLEQMLQRLQEVCASEGVEVPTDALELIVRRANGGMRDALGMLDQVFSYQRQQITRADVMRVLGLVDDSFLAELFDKLLQGDAAQLLLWLSTALHQGREARQIAREGASYLRDLLMWSILKEKAELNFVSEPLLPRLQEQAPKLSSAQQLWMLQKLMTLTERLRFGEESQFLLEMTFLELLEMLHQPAETVSAPKARPRRRETEPIAVQPAVSSPPEATPKAAETEAFWTKVLEAVKEKQVTTHALLKEGSFIGIQGDKVFVAYRRGFRFHKERIETKENMALVQEVMRRISGKNLHLELILQEDARYNELLVSKAVEIFGAERVQMMDEEEK